MPKVPCYDLLSVKEVADRLQLTERQVWNLIKTGRLNSKKISGRTWVSLVELSRYKLLFQDTHLIHVFSTFPSEYAGSGFWKICNFGATSPVFRLTVSLEDWWRVSRPFQDPSAYGAYDAIKAEVQWRLGSEATENFSVQFNIEQQSLGQTLRGVIKSVEPPTIPLYDKEELGSMAMEHLVESVLPKLGQPRDDPIKDPIAYLKKAVQNFYTDMARQRPKEIAFGGPEEIEAIVVKKAHKLSGRKPHLKTPDQITTRKARKTRP